jgi:acetylglutamate kinase
MTVRQQKTVKTLLEAMPYIRRFWGKTIVVKYGGAAMTSKWLQEQFAADMVLLRLVGMKPVVVHGGGSQVSRYMGKLDMKVEFVDGQRVTDAATMEVARMVLVGKVNKDIVALINRHGGAAVGLSGEDGRLISATRREHVDAKGDTHDLGFVGDVASVNPGVLTLLAEEVIPVVASVGSDEDGQAWNINADAVAGELAAALSAEKVIFLSDVEGIYENQATEISPVSECDLDYLGTLQASGAISGGMIPKVAAVRRALEAGVGSAHIIDGRVEHAVLLEVLTDAGCGTKVTA